MRARIFLERPSRHRATQFTRGPASLPAPTSWRQRTHSRMAYTSPRQIAKAMESIRATLRPAIWDQGYTHTHTHKHTHKHTHAHTHTLFLFVLACVCVCRCASFEAQRTDRAQTFQDFASLSGKYDLIRTCVDTGMHRAGDGSYLKCNMAPGDSEHRVLSSFPSSAECFSLPSSALLPDLALSANALARLTHPAAPGDRPAAANAAAPGRAT